MGIVNIIKFLLNHPLSKRNLFKSLKRFLFWQISFRLHPHKSIVPFVNDSLLIINKGLAGATGNYYCGLHEFEDMSFLLHFLRINDLFFDIGANIGSYTILASAVSKANVVSVEPSNLTFRLLENNISINRSNSFVNCLNIGVGSEKGTARLTADFDAINHILTNAELENKVSYNEVEIETIDNLVSKYGCPILIKIDVEGFESEVIKGAHSCLSSPDLKAIIIELNGSSNRYNQNENLIHKYLIDIGFKPFDYFPFERKLILKDGKGSHNTIYIKDYYFALNRVSTADKFSVVNESI